MGPAGVLDKRGEREPAAEASRVWFGFDQTALDRILVAVQFDYEPDRGIVVFGHAESIASRVRRRIGEGP